ncbi:hypothetical protein, partial [Phocaeicola vulgatus]|uniref:hypothetical protein n=3 Tax=Phocaeicola vulgatus TaxID=821 RepID=UPI0039908229
YINPKIFVRSEDRDFNYEPIFDCLLTILAKTERGFITNSLSVSTFTKSNLFFILSHQEKQELYYCCK